MYLVHGMARRGKMAPEYQIWAAMKRRCYNPNVADYYLYGGRGIRVCDRWRDSFKAFFEDMGKRPEGGYSLDRINSSGDYTPENCRWATALEQRWNRRDTKFVSFNGVSKPLGEWARIYGISVSRLCIRLWRGWSVERALTEPLQPLVGPRPLARHRKVS